METGLCRDCIRFHKMDALYIVFFPYNSNLIGVPQKQPKRLRGIVVVLEECKGSRTVIGCKGYIGFSRARACKGNIGVLAGPWQMRYMIASNLGVGLRVSTASEERIGFQEGFLHVRFTDGYCNGMTAAL